MRKQRQRLNAAITKGHHHVEIDEKGNVTHIRTIATPITVAAVASPGSTIVPPAKVNANPNRKKKPSDIAKAGPVNAAEKSNKVTNPDKDTREVVRGGQKKIGVRRAEETTAKVSGTGQPETVLMTGKNSMPLTNAAGKKMAATESVVKGAAGAMWLPKDEGGTGFDIGKYGELAPYKPSEHAGKSMCPGCNQLKPTSELRRSAKPDLSMSAFKPMVCKDCA